MAAYLNVIEYPAGNYAGIQAPVCPAVTEQPRLEFSGGVQQSAAFSGDTRLIEVGCDTACHVLVGGINPIATVNSNYFYAGRVSYFIVTPGDKLSVIPA